MELFRAKYDAEQHLRASGARWTIVRATAFVELWAEIMAKPIVFGRGDNPINFVSVDDVAAVVERAVVDPSLRGEVLEVGGPQNLTFNELARPCCRDPRPAPQGPPRAASAAAGVGARAAKPRAALAMDTIDMTFDAATAATHFADLPVTDIRTALHAVSGAPRPEVKPRSA